MRKTISAILAVVAPTPDTHMLIFRSGWLCRFFHVC